MYYSTGGVGVGKCGSLTCKGLSVVRVRGSIHPCGNNHPVEKQDRCQMIKNSKKGGENLEEKPMVPWLLRRLALSR